ncbi:MAG: radical SAM protein [Clostridiales bacterium]|jgi:MoaA/NifB/PqqE/SkfB family radical SAM enzyme|nr:radical SAM protein [Clostridiales bacterium]
MLSNLKIAKQHLGERIINQLLNYLKQDPMSNIPRALDLLCRAPIAPRHRQLIQQLKLLFENSPVMKIYFNRILTEVNENVQQRFLFNLFINASLIGIPKHIKLSQELGYNIPYTILIDPTSKCNLKCKGCWAGAYPNHKDLSFEEVDRIITEAKELGIYFFVMSGGEPLMWPYIFQLCEKHGDAAFMIYTNGTLIDEATAEKMQQAGNITPAISLEGGREYTDSRRGTGVYDTIMAAMDNLKKHGIIFGISLTVTSQNYLEVFSDEFIDAMIHKGVLYGWSFHYMPIGRSPDFSLVLKPEQRAWLIDRVRYIRSHKPIQIADFWNDGQMTQGCIAGGKYYFHINAAGDVEPCAFVHFAVDNIKGKSLKQVLNSPLFSAYQKRQPFSRNLLRPCPFIDVPQALREIVAESGAVETHDGAGAVLFGSAGEKIEGIANNWKPFADVKWQEIEERNKSKGEEAVS